MPEKTSGRARRSTITVLKIALMLALLFLLLSFLGSSPASHDSPNYPCGQYNDCP